MLEINMYFGDFLVFLVVIRLEVSKYKYFEYLKITYLENEFFVHSTLCNFKAILHIWFKCLSSGKLKDAQMIGDSITPEDLGRVSLLIYCYLNDLNQFCRGSFL